MASLKSATVIEALNAVLLKRQNPIVLHEPYFAGNEWTYVKDCLDTGWVSSVGSYVDRFEAMLAEYVGVKYAIATVNGTAALHICLKLVGVEEGDEVMMPTLTFVASANAVRYCGAIPHFVDSEERTLGVDPAKLRDYLEVVGEMRPDGFFNKITGRRIKALLPMHTFGHPVDLDPLIEICEHYQINLVEEAAEALGSFYKGQHVGNSARISALSFNGNKVITTGGGGAILTNDDHLGKMAKHLTTTARVPHKWSFIHDQVGFNYRLPNINAALGCAQLEQLSEFLVHKRELAEQYMKAFEHIEGIRFFREPDFARSNYWLNILLLDKADMEIRDAILEATNGLGIMTRPVWTLMHNLPMFSEFPRMDLSVAEDIEGRLLNIPSSVVLGMPNE